jgi:hypothetical protein
MKKTLDERRAGPYKEGKGFKLDFKAVDKGM